MLQTICDEMGLKQFIREPTREKHLLDLVLSDVNLRCEVGAKVADHAYITAVLDATVQKTVTMKREVWNYKGADWEQFRGRLECTDWSFIHARRMPPPTGQRPRY